jgi:hypothetical protein
MENRDYEGNEQPRSNDDRSQGKKSQIRLVLTHEQAREIFCLKSSHGCASLHAASIRLAGHYKVSSKAIRDIWKGRSWLDSTFDLWDSSDRPPRRTIGRPKGKKDSKPRSRGASTIETNSLLNCPQIDKAMDSTTSNGMQEVNQQVLDLVHQIAVQRNVLSQLLSPAFPSLNSALPQIYTVSSDSHFCSSANLILPSLESLIGNSLACQRFVRPSTRLVSPNPSAADYVRPLHGIVDHCDVHDGMLSWLRSTPPIPALLDSCGAGSAPPSLPGILLPPAPQ